MPLIHVKSSRSASGSPLRQLLTWLTALICAGLTACASGSSAAPQWRSAEGVVWATTYHITYRAPADLSDSIIAAMRRVELSLSPFEPLSRISALNAGTDSVADALICRVFRRSVDVNEASAGMFDPTVGPLIELWGFGKNRIDSPAPSDSAINAALARVGILRCSIDSAGIIHKPHPATMFNFSAITKGLGVDEVAAALARGGATDWLVEIGGEMTLHGRNSRDRLWRVSVDAPLPDSTATHRGLLTIDVTDCAIATSGNYRNFHHTPNGERVGHTISPRTGRPVASDILSATVIAHDCMTADALATACMALGSDSALVMVSRFPGAKALLVMEGDPLRIVTTPGFPAFNR
ncbi:MAG: FAD:protein FMN transferase [Candidatus Amulumruptor caecigallinarius]|nr:FAD:protein FMN transferase [Candidatus Amulumruptor caecigallinarius]MCM1396980.1 FAD:protein FMN transferase [Candidatus Amulumruptor caecigallinarius]MCM1453986.1 FAD:protein FMN transferase [bacterium]